MKTIHERIREMAAIFDQQGRPEQPIAVRASRAYLMREFKPQRRGDTLFCGSHPLTVNPAPNMDAPWPENP